MRWNIWIVSPFLISPVYSFIHDIRDWEEKKIEGNFNSVSLHHEYASVLIFYLYFLFLQWWDENIGWVKAFIGVPWIYVKNVNPLKQPAFLSTLIICFNILSVLWSFFHLNVLESFFISSRQLSLCKQKDFLYSLRLPGIT